MDLTSVTHRIVCFTLFLVLSPGCASVADRMVRGAERGAQRAAEREAQRQADLAVTRAMNEAEEAVICLVTDAECIARAQGQGKTVEIVDAEGNPVNGDAEQAVLPVDRPIWRFDVGNEQIKGTRSLVSRGDGQLVLQFVSKDGINLVMIVPEDGPPRRDVITTYYADGRGELCEMVTSTPPFYIHFEASDGPWLRGRYAGSLACPDYTELVVNGSFNIQNPED